MPASGDGGGTGFSAASGSPAPRTPQISRAEAVPAPEHAKTMAAVSQTTLVCMWLFTMMTAGNACDTGGMTTCLSTMTTGMSAGREDPSSSCDVVNTFMTCISSACAGCDTSAVASFETSANAQVANLCTGDAAVCPDHAVCTARITCGGGGVSSSASQSPSAVAVAGLLLPFIG